jgi:hypothetical protein
MKQDDPQQVVDLSRYREATRRATAAKAARPKPASEGMFGSRRGAPLILALIVIVALALWLGPKLTNLI